MNYDKALISILALKYGFRVCQERRLHPVGGKCEPVEVSELLALITRPAAGIW
jgi:hypothetical protein